MPFLFFLKEIALLCQKRKEKEIALLPLIFY
jgi:hypothetical protein